MKTSPITCEPRHTPDTWHLPSSAPIECYWQRTYDHQMPPYLVTLRIPLDHDGARSLDLANPQSRGVMDDFGALVLLRPWR